ncbi:MAG: hypothetical protein Q8P53_02150 [Candidatus Shapirobacteria bacterium]|nr:hypothetical protein [Candidatus Shapirobacteria bacterium]
MKKLNEIKITAKQFLIISVISFLLSFIAFEGPLFLISILSLGISIYTLGVNKNNIIIKIIGGLIIAWILYIFLFSKPV